MNKKELLVLSLVTFLVFIVWISTDIYRTKSNIEISPKLQQALEPLNPNFDKTFLERIKSQNLNQSIDNNPESSDSGEL
ncbi:hypothetical protein HYS91_01365 [Candidatus Daviesbacteria bacterium]|nr:hypothetical protein [Candidatus Daviesbacteria bacterium]